MQIIQIPKIIIIQIFRFENEHYNDFVLPYWKSVVILYDICGDLYYIKYVDINDDDIWMRLVTKPSLKLILKHIRKQKLKKLLK